MQPAGFWSYTRRDNEQDHSRITRLADRIRDEYSLITGEDLRLFVDRESIEWGDEWRERIDNALQDTTFFIPLVTPRFFQSEECRRELLTFAGHAKSLHVEELLLPILYVDVEGLSPDSGDEAMALVARTQYANWTELRLVEEDSERYRQEVNKLALKLRDVASDVGARAVVIPGEASRRDTATHQHAIDDDLDDDSPGLLDLVADAQPKMESWTESISAFGPVMDEINRLTEEATLKIQRGDQEGKPYNYRIVVSRELASQLVAPAEEMRRLADRYASELAGANPSILAMIRLVEASSDDPEALPFICELFETIRGLVRTARETAASTQQWADVLGQNAKLSKDLRPSMNMIRQALRGVLDGLSIIEDWEHQILRSSVDCAGQTPAVNS